MRSHDELGTRPSLELGRPSDFDHDWFSQPPISSEPPPSLRPPPALVGDPTGSFWLGAVSGGVGGVLMLVVAQSLLDSGQSGLDLVSALGRAASATGIPSLPGRLAGGLVCAAVSGALLGAPLGLAAQRLVRVAPRLVFFSFLLPVLWIFVHALVLRRITPTFAARLPVGPLVIGALVYGVCIAVVRPARARPRRP